MRSLNKTSGEITHLFEIRHIETTNNGTNISGDNELRVGMVGIGDRNVVCTGEFVKTLQEIDKHRSHMRSLFHCFSISPLCHEPYGNCCFINTPTTECLLLNISQFTKIDHFPGESVSMPVAH
jgi:hypothetical protein